MKYVTNDISGEATTPLSTTWYYYNDLGNVTQIVTNPEGEDDYSATRFGYARNRASVSFVLGETWNWVTGTYEITYAREFRYDGARQRYLNRELDPVALQSSGALVAVADDWSDYDGDAIYGDFSVDTDTGEVQDKQSYGPGTGRFAWMDDGSGTSVPDAASLLYYESDALGTTRHLVDSSDDRIGPVVYTAFGERIDGFNHRYGYAGAWGYQAHSFGEVSPPLDPDTVFPYLHVGARYYDPTTGRFLQRDPMGIRAGLNVYAYVENAPTIYIDPDGRSQFDVGACGRYCLTRDKTCRAGAKTVKAAGKCVFKLNACTTSCGNADAESEMGDDKGPPPYGPPPATFDPYPSGGPHWRAIVILLFCSLFLWGTRAQPLPRASK